MPIIRSKDSHGSYYAWGDPQGHKYYYVTNNTQSRKEAKAKAVKQAVAASYSMARVCSGRKGPKPAYCSEVRRFPATLKQEAKAQARDFIAAKR